MMGLIILLLFVFVLIVLGINLVIARKFEDIAFKKGYDSSVHSFAMCFWLGIIGCLYVIALPDLNVHLISDSNSRHTIKDSTATSSVAKYAYDAQPNSVDTNADIIDEEKLYNSLVAKAEKFKDTFYDRDYRIRTYESIIKNMEILANKNYKDSAAKIQEYTNHLNLLKAKKIK